MWNSSEPRGISRDEWWWQNWGIFAGTDIRERRYDVRTQHWTSRVSSTVHVEPKRHFSSCCAPMCDRDLNWLDTCRACASISLFVVVVSRCSIRNAEAPEFASVVGVIGSMLMWYRNCIDICCTFAERTMNTTNRLTTTRRTCKQSTSDTSATIFDRRPTEWW